MLRDIENPKGILSVPRIAVPPLPNSSLTAVYDYSTKSYQQSTTISPKASPVGPTGWKPPQSASLPIVSRTGLPKYPINKLEMAAPERTAASVERVAASERREETTPAVSEYAVYDYSNAPNNNPSRQPTLVRGIKGDKVRPQSEAPQSSPASPAKNENEKVEEDFLDQKLQAPMAVPKEERHYSSDPYREPLQ